MVGMLTDPQEGQPQMPMMPQQGMMSDAAVPPVQQGMEGTDFAEVERKMAETVKKEAPEDIAEFLGAMQEDGITVEEVDEVRQVTLAALNSPDAYPTLVTYLINAELIDPEDAPPNYDGGFVLAILGLVGAAEELVTQRSV